MNLFCCMKNIIRLIFFLLILLIVTIVYANEVNDIIKPTVNIKNLKYEELISNNYYSFLNEFTKKIQLRGVTYLEAIYIDPKLQLLKYQNEKEIDRESFEHYKKQLTELYSEKIPFIVKMQNSAKQENLQLDINNIYIKTDTVNKIKPLELCGNDPEYKLSFSKGSFWEKEYTVFFPSNVNGRDRVIDTNTKFVELVLNNNAKEYRVRWKFIETKSIMNKVDFYILIKISLIVFILFISIILVITRPRGNYEI